MKSSIIALSLVILSGQHAVAAELKCPVRIVTVLMDGSVKIEGKKYSDPVELRIARNHMRCGKSVWAWHLTANESTSFDAMAKAVKIMADSGGMKIGYINAQGTSPAK